MVIQTYKAIVQITPSRLRAMEKEAIWGLKLEGMEKTNKSTLPIRICTEYSHMLSYNELRGPSEEATMVVRPWEDIYDMLPPALFRRKYGVRQTVYDGTKVSREKIKSTGNGQASR